MQTLAFHPIRWRLLLPIAIAIVAVAILAKHGPIPQESSYHDFADQRTLLGIPHFWDVISNLPFLVAGIVGFRAVRDKPSGLLPELRVAYTIFFFACALLAFGSGYYHLQPNNDRLMWDHLPMAIGFMAFFAAIVGEHISLRAARVAITPLIAWGSFSVLWWRVTEANGHGDLRLYIAVQFLPMLLIPVIIALFPSRLTRVGYVGAVMLWYALAKILELCDQRVYELSGVVSGHTLKHLASAVAMFVVIRALRRRTVVEKASTIVPAVVEGLP